MKEKLESMIFLKREQNLPQIVEIVCAPPPTRIST